MPAVNASLTSQENPVLHVMEYSGSHNHSSPSTDDVRNLIFVVLVLEVALTSHGPAWQVLCEARPRSITSMHFMT